MMEEIKNRIKSVMIGHAVADALGVPVEFQKRDVLKKSPVTDMMGYGTYPVPVGSWSDDTSMSIAALDCIAEGSVDWDSIMEAFGRWYYNDDYTPTGVLFDVGGTCSYAIGNYFNLNLPAVECGACDSYSNGNGSLMRIHPFSMLAWYKKDLRDNFDAFIDTASALTHAHERSKLACKIYTHILFELFKAPEKSSVINGLSKARNLYCANPEYAHYKKLLESDFALVPEQEIKSSGYVVDTLEAAVWSLLTTNSYTECVLKAVNLGEDTDTVAAIAGGLAGALYGYESIPRNWRDALIKLEYIEDMCDRAARHW